MRQLTVVLAVALVAACSASTADFDTLTPPPPPSAGAFVAPTVSFAAPTFTFAVSTVPPVRTLATARITAAPTAVSTAASTAARPSPTAAAARPTIFFVWNGAARASDGSIAYVVVLKDFPPNTRVTLLRYRDPSGTTQVLNTVVTTRADGSQTTASLVTSGAVGDHVVDWEFPLNGRTQGQTTFALSRTIADRAAGTTSASACPAAPVSARFEPAQIATGASATLRLTGVCPGEIVTFVRIVTAAGQHFGFGGEASIALYRDAGVAWRVSNTYGTGTHTIFVWVKSQELRATLETR